MESNSPSQVTRQVQVPHSYFRKAKSEYADWRWAMVREFIQNAYDARAAHIDFQVILTEDQQLELRVDDDGSGMDSDILLNVLLCMGGSRKPSGAIGGFGYAKAILFFAHAGYTIRTRDMLVVGHGGEYQLRHEQASVPGTRISVTLDDEGDSLELWQDCIAQYVLGCYMEYVNARPVVITLDGRELPQNNDREYEVALRSSLGDIWYDEVLDSARSTFVVSVQGLPMFTEVTYSTTNQTALHGGIELEAGSTALTANRDGFTSEWREKFSEVVGNLVQDHSAARFGHAMDLSINYESSEPRKQGNAAEDQTERPSQRTHGMVLFTAGEHSGAELAHHALELHRIQRERYPSNFHLKVASMSARRTAKSEAYITASEVLAELNKVRSYKLAHIWQAAVCAVLSSEWARDNGVAFYDAFGRLIDDQASYGLDTASLQPFFRDQRVDVGFCFISNTEGLCSSPVEDVAPHRVFINPLLLTTESRFRALDALDIAFHEVAHLWERHHGESFCGVEAKLRQSVRRRWSEKDLVASLIRTRQADESREA